MRISDWSSDVCSSDLNLRDDVRSLRGDVEKMRYDLDQQKQRDQAVEARLQRLEGGAVAAPQAGYGTGDTYTAPVAAAPTAGYAPPAAAPTSTYSAPAAPPPTTTGTAASSNRSEEHTSELQSLMRISYAVFCMK